VVEPHCPVLGVVRLPLFTGCSVFWRPLSIGVVRLLCGSLCVEGTRVGALFFYAHTRVSIREPTLDGESGLTNTLDPKKEVGRGRFWGELRCLNYGRLQPCDLRGNVSGRHQLRSCGWSSCRSCENYCVRCEVTCSVSHKRPNQRTFWVRLALDRRLPREKFEQRD